MTHEKMGFDLLRLSGRPLSVHKAIVAPDFKSKTVLVTDTWEYVTLWLRRHHQKSAAFYWEQANQFFDASRDLPNTSSPLTLYYCFLNAVKCLLSVRGIPLTEYHGVSGESEPGRTSLSNEKIAFKGSGVLAGLCTYLGEPAGGKYSLQDLLYNLVYIHRAYKLTYSSRPELFVPVAHPRFVRKSGSNKAWFCAELEGRDASLHSVNKLPGFERDNGVETPFTIRRKKRFNWLYGAGHKIKNLQELTRYHRELRARLFYIHGPTRLWYLKRGGELDGLIPRSSLTMTFAAMHRLSELARYEPMGLVRHFECQHNWLLSEFIATARTQFIDEISSEITGQEFMIPGRKSVA